MRELRCPSPAAASAPASSPSTGPSPRVAASSPSPAVPAAPGWPEDLPPAPPRGPPAPLPHLLPPPLPSGAGGPLADLAESCPEVASQLEEAYFRELEGTVARGSRTTLEALARCAGAAAARLESMADSMEAGASRTRAMGMARAFARCAGLLPSRAPRDAAPPPSPALRAAITTCLLAARRLHEQMPTSSRVELLDWAAWMSVRDFSIAEVAVAVAVLGTRVPVPLRRAWDTLTRDAAAPPGSRRARRVALRDRVEALFGALIESPCLRECLQQMHASECEWAREKRSLLLAHSAGEAGSREHLATVLRQTETRVLQHHSWLEGELDRDEAADFDDEQEAGRALRANVGNGAKFVEALEERERRRKTQQRRERLRTLQSRRARARADAHSRSIGGRSNDATPLEEALGGCSESSVLSPRLTDKVINIAVFTLMLLDNRRPHLENRLVLPPPVVLPGDLLRAAEALALRLESPPRGRRASWRAARARVAELLTQVREVDTAARADDVLWLEIREIYRALPMLGAAREELARLAAELDQEKVARAEARSLREAAVPGHALGERASSTDGAHPSQVGDACADTPGEAPASAPDPVTKAAAAGQNAAEALAGPSICRPIREALSSWIAERFDRGTFASPLQSATYHFNKHAAHLAGATLEAYVEQAHRRARVADKRVVCRRITNPNALLFLVDDSDTFLLFDESRRVISFRDRRQEAFSSDESPRLPSAARTVQR